MQDLNDLYYFARVFEHGGAPAGRALGVPKSKLSRRVALAARKGPSAGSWLACMQARKPRMMVAVALANRIARVSGPRSRMGEPTEFRGPLPRNTPAVFGSSGG
jgi:hypothetical protein